MSEAQRQTGIVPPESRANAAARMRRTRAAASRREAVNALRLGSDLCNYAAGQLANGLTPEQARDTALETAAELNALATALRRLTRPAGAPDRRAQAVQLANLGLTNRQIAVRLGVSTRAVSSYFSGR
jgi:DNA-binding NarL/FixJ family response regulator